MKTFLIIVAVLVILIALLMSLSATITVVYDKGWHSSIQVLFIKKDLILSDILSFLMFPERKAESARKKYDEDKKKKKVAEEVGNTNAQEVLDKKIDEDVKDINSAEEKVEDKKVKAQKPNYFQQLWDKEGIVGIMSLVTNLIETGSSAVSTLFRGFHIYSLYVKMIIGGADAADIAEKYGMVCSFYYPLKGIILNGMKVDQYDDYVQPDFIAPRSEYEFQIIGSLSVGLIFRMVIKAGFVFLKNFIKDK